MSLKDTAHALAHAIKDCLIYPPPSWLESLNLDESVPDVAVEASTVDKECDCQEWQDSMEQINGAMIFCALQAAGPKYTGSLFGFCPWCGSRLSAITVPDSGGSWKCKECGAESMNWLPHCPCCGM